jgi:TatD DNase family protein
MKLFDSHCHLHDEKFRHDRDDALARARAEGVEAILTLGDTIRASREAIALAEKESVVLAAAGVHPSAAASWDDDTAAKLEELLAHPRAVVLGEIGLDYYWDKDPEVHRKQRIAFREQLAMARRLGYAVSIHSRESNDDVLEDLRSERGGEIGGVLHCFNGTFDQARAGLDMGFYIGVGGTSTYPKSADLREVLKKIGPQHLLLETDSPYLPPQPRRGRRNEPAYVAMTAATVAEFLDVPLPELAEITWRNTINAFRLEDKL